MASELYVETLKGLTSGANANKVIIPSGQTLEIDAWSPPAGTVLQVVNATYNVSTTTTAAGYADTGLSASITPSSTSSKILVAVCQAGVGKSEPQDEYVRLQLLRDSTSICLFEQQAGFTLESTRNLVGTCATTYLDSPSTTSSVTYKTQFKPYSSGQTSIVQANSGVSTITLMEIAG